MRLIVSLKVCWCLWCWWSCRCCVCNPSDDRKLNFYSSHGFHGIMNHHAHEDSSQVSLIWFITPLYYTSFCAFRGRIVRVSIVLSLSLSFVLFFLLPSFLVINLISALNRSCWLKKKKKSRAADCVCTDVAEIHTDAPITVLIIHSLSLFLTLCPFLFLSLSLAHDISFFFFSFSLSLFPSLSLSVSLSLYLYLSRPLCTSPCLSLTVFLTRSICPSRFLRLSLSCSVSLSMISHWWL